MEVTHWIAEHWFELFQTAGIIVGFAFTAHTLRKDSEARKMANTIALNQEHHSIWKQMFERSELSRIKEERLDLLANPISHEERLFVTFLILHLSVIYRAMKTNMVFPIAGVNEDIRQFFSRSIPKAVWEKIKSSQNKDFVAFVEKA